MLAANEKPACSITADAALAGPTGSFTCGAFFPIVDANSALIQALTSLSVNHLPASLIGEADVVSDLSTIRTVRDRAQLLFHAGILLVRSLRLHTLSCTLLCYSLASIQRCELA
jgi:hypothetical protein